MPRNQCDFKQIVLKVDHDINIKIIIIVYYKIILTI